MSRVLTPPFELLERFADFLLPEDERIAEAVRITVDREFNEMYADSVEFWTPGSPTFSDLGIYRHE